MYIRTLPKEGRGVGGWGEMKTKQRYSDGLFLCDGENMFGNVIIRRGRGISQNIRNADKRAGGGVIITPQESMT